LQRNTLLKEFNRGTPFNAELLDVYSEQLSLLGALIHSERIKFIDEFVPVFQKYYSIISGDNEKVDLSYQSQLNDNDMLSLLSSNSEKDRILEYTSVGIHKDDLQLNISGYPIKRLGSQGQQKTYVVAIKFAEFDFITKFNGVKPILLLDDIFDKFDSQRVEQIIKLVSNEQFGQIFITDTDLNRIEHILENHSGSHKVFRVEKDGIII
jgi:DNA replication and repair protein RecF